MSDPRSRRPGCGVSDCAPPERGPAPVRIRRRSQAIDYLAKDYDSFQRAMIDLLPTRAPGWVDHTEADLGMALVELFAYLGDQLSYYQDRVAAEGFLSTAARRDSVCRHLRLIDYRLDPGCAATVRLQFRVAEALVLPPGFAVATSSGRGADTLIFETEHESTLQPKLNAMVLSADAPSDALGLQAVLRDEIGEEYLPAGSWLFFEDGDGGEWAQLAGPPIAGGGTTTVTFTAPLGSTYAAHEFSATGTGLPQQSLELAFPAPPRPTGFNAELNSFLEVAVADVAWTEVRDLATSAAGDQHFAVVRTDVDRVKILFGDNTHGASPGIEAAILVRYRRVRGNAVDATHGASRVQTIASTGEAGQTIALEHGPLTWLDDAAGEPRSSLAVEVDDEPWYEVEDFVASGVTDHHYRVALDDDGFASVRFGDGIRGRRPALGATIRLRYREGNGERGLVGPRSIVNIPKFPTSVPATVASAKFAVLNPRGSRGGRDAEDTVTARVLGPHAICEGQNRAVTPSDFEQLALAGVWYEGSLVTPVGAKARFAWTGSWREVVVSLDFSDRSDLSSEHALLAAFAESLAPKKLAGFGLAVEPARYAALHVSLVVKVDPRHFAREVHRDLERALGPETLEDGEPGFFTPGQFGFGDAVHLSDLYATAMAVRGVVAVRTEHFKRFGQRYPERKMDGTVTVGDLEVARCDSDPDRPEFGLLSIRTVGGKEG